MEELKAILETVAALGDSARVLYLWWLAKEVFEIAIHYTVVGGFIYGAYKLGDNILRRVSFGQRVCEYAGITWPPLESEMKEVLRRLKSE